MKTKNLFPNQSQKASNSDRTPVEKGLVQREIESAPPGRELARKASLRFVNEILLPWRELQRWLTAAAKSVAEQKLVKARSFYHRDYPQK